MNSLVTRQSRALSPSVPRELVSRLLWLPDHARSMGTHLMAGKGSGKSRLMGRLIAWLDFVRGIPQVVLDPHGPTIDNFLDKLTRQPREVQEHLWTRVLYIDMSGRSGRVVSFPLYYRLGREGLYEVSQRYLDVVRKLDPNLHTASVEGWNPLWRIGTAAGMVLAALGYQISEAESLVRNPDMWSGRLQRALEVDPDVRPAVDFFREYALWKEEARIRRSDSFLNKVALFTLDPSMKAMFGASRPGIDWQRVVDKRLTVLLDFRHEHDLERRRFKMLWAFHTLMGFIKHRGAGRHRPLGLIVNELTSLFSAQTLSTDLFAAELDELINVIARNYMVWLTLAHQELFQLDEHAQKVLMAMGTQVLGVTSDPDAAIAAARQFFRYDPYWVKKREPVYNSFMGMERVIDWRTVEFTVQEQELLQSERFRDQRRFHFLVRPAPGEGDVTGALQAITLDRFDHGQYVNEELVAQAREMLMEKRGQPVGEVLAAIDARLQILPTGAQLPGTMRTDERTHDDDNIQFGEKGSAAHT